MPPNCWSFGRIASGRAGLGAANRRLPSAQLRAWPFKEVLRGRRLLRAFFVAFYICLNHNSSYSQEDAMLDRALSWIGPTKKSGPDSTEADETRETTGGEPSDGIGPVCVGVVEGPLRAEIARTYLEQAGISVYLQGEALGSVYGFTS